MQMSEEEKGLKVGDPAPDFLLNDQSETEFRLSDQKGKKVLLSFHPLAWTGVCADQMRSLEDNQDKFAGLNTVAVGLSVDSVPCKKAWADDLGLKKTRILADFWHHGEIAKRFDLFRQKNGFSERANVIVDEDGKLVFVKVYPIKELPDIGEIVGFLGGQG
jgi:peroxiredoxin